ncbi:MAG: sulfide/dihydroorotate dehydrogenase-like FAD/NAD-binding protein [Candidatus Lokiarchaeota archaeon]|nr:sulfide/dihydroorotate dehydrogenase-like FAD/NAD-binding protein [Candidatus Lokiarchaeota archaeon]
MKIIIDQHELEFTEGETILQIAKRNEIYIPTLCNLEDLTPYGGCRLCIVRILNDRKPFQTACSTPAIKDMEVITKDEELQEMRREVLQLILSEHPSGCLVCAHHSICEELLKEDRQKSGRVFGCFSCPKKDICELREIVEYLGINKIDYEFEYKNYPLEREDPFFDRDYNLCILCGRCIRVCNEMRGIGAINFMYRGHDTKISTGGNVLHIDSNCLFCGACVDTCPTGALSSKNTKWVKTKNNKTTSICTFCSVDCGFDYYTLEEKLMESIPSKGDLVNKGQACVIGRFCTPHFVNSKSRLKYPMIRKDDILIPCKWDEAYETIRNKLSLYNSDEIALIASPDLTNESAYLLKKFGNEVLSTPHIVQATNFIPFFTDKDQSFNDIPHTQWILLLNTNIQITHPILLIRLKQARDNGAKILSLNIGNVELPYETRNLFDIELNVPVQDATSILVAMLGTQNKLLLRDLGLKIDEKVLERYNLADFVEMRRYQRGTILMGNYVNLPPLYMNNLQKLIMRLAREGESQISCIGLWNHGNLNGVSKFIPQTLDKITEKIASGDIKAIFTTERLSNINTQKTELLIVQDMFESKFSKNADIVLPVASPTEQSGHVTNAEMQNRRLIEVAPPIGHSKPDWLVLTELARVFQLTDRFKYINSEEIYEESLDLQMESTDIDLDFKDIKKLTLEELPLNHFTLRDFTYRGQSFSHLVPNLQFLINQREGKLEEAKFNQVEKTEATEFKVVHIEEKVPNMFKLVVHAPLLANKSRPGNFAIIMTEETSERVPITLSDWDSEKGTVTFFFQERGFSTKELSEVKSGDYLHSVVGPLGNPIEIEKNKTLLLGGGCYGMGALYPVAKAAKEIGNKVIMIMEGKSKDLLYLQKEYEQLVDKVVYITSDGSYGHKGSEHGKIATGIEVVAQTENVDVAYFVGCEMMMMEASQMTEKLGIPTFVSLNTIMLDGTGMCGACRLTINENGHRITKFACVDGPVFDGHKIDWDELMKRGVQFSHKEVEVYRANACRALTKFNLKQEES